MYSFFSRMNCECHRVSEWHQPRERVYDCLSTENDTIFFADLLPVQHVLIDRRWVRRQRRHVRITHGLVICCGHVTQAQTYARTVSKTYSASSLTCRRFGRRPACEAMSRDEAMGRGAATTQNPSPVAASLTSAHPLAIASLQEFRVANQVRRHSCVPGCYGPCTPQTTAAT